MFALTLRGELPVKLGAGDMLSEAPAERNAHRSLGEGGCLSPIKPDPNHNRKGARPPYPITRSLTLAPRIDIAQT